ncbi:hypothetical protein K461DRAFT_264099 [Myriangium duriaei CBS 260.36]|uniref:Uncharacterized protein n=1 Tax=Myriangium duriaei CBS 260.36 TaxID=1168546 RepID=A0A9P4JCJ8_9PEZI|nr:hypothetical protein K461DRAFT_264099 [Myriangium duriaei CBS 260.36]
MSLSLALLRRLGQKHLASSQLIDYFTAGTCRRRAQSSSWPLRVKKPPPTTKLRRSAPLGPGPVTSPFFSLDFALFLDRRPDWRIPLGGISPPSAPIPPSFLYDSNTLDVTCELLIFWRAARERREEYKAHFKEHQEENAKRVRRISQLRGDHNTTNFLYDSAYGTGAASRQSLQDTTQPAYAPQMLRRTGGRPFSMIHDSYDPAPPREYGSTSTGYESLEGSTVSNFDARRSMSVTPTAGPLGSHPLGPLPGTTYAAEPPTYEQIAVSMPVTRQRPRPISLPATMHRSTSRIPGMVDDWWQSSSLTPDHEYGEHVQVLNLGQRGDDRELRMTAMVA